MFSAEEYWQDIAWNGVTFQVPPSWQPTVIHNSFLFFEQDGRPVFAIKWEQIRGRLSVKRTLKKLRKSLKVPDAVIEPWDIESELLVKTKSYSITGFQYQLDQEKYWGTLVYCPHCNRATMLQTFLTEDEQNRQDLQRILNSFSDHQDSLEQKWAMCDIRAYLPTEAKLESHEFMLGRYTLTFTLQHAKISLYRFKPAAVILRNQTLEEFGESLADGAEIIKQVNHHEIKWEYKASGFGRIQAFLNKKPIWTWLKLIHDQEKNGILAIKGTGRKQIDRHLLEKIADNFTVTETC